MKMYTTSFFNQIGIQIKLLHRKANTAFGCVLNYYELIEVNQIV